MMKTGKTEEEFYGIQLKNLPRAVETRKNISRSNNLKQNQHRTHQGCTGEHDYVDTLTKSTTYQYDNEGKEF